MHQDSSKGSEYTLGVYTAGCGSRLLDSDDKESAFNVGDPSSIPGLGRPPWRRKWPPIWEDPPGEGNDNPFQYSCLENPHGQRSLVGYSPWGHKRVGHDLVTNTHFSSSLLSAIRVVSPAYLRLLTFLLANLIPAFSIWSQSIVPCPVLTVAS